MYCKKCGKILETDAKFCSNCGAKVEKEEPFVPAFMKSYGLESESDKESKPKRKTYEREQFDWNLEGFPDPGRKTDTVDFNWSSVLEENQKRIYGMDRDRERKPLFDSAEMSFDEDTVAAYEAREKAREEAARAEATARAAAAARAEMEAEMPIVARPVTETQEEAEKEFEELLNSLPELKESEYEIPDSLFKGLDNLESKAHVVTEQVIEKPENVSGVKEEPAAKSSILDGLSEPVWNAEAFAEKSAREKAATREAAEREAAEKEAAERETAADPESTQKSLEEELFGEMGSLTDEEAPEATIVAGRRTADSERVDKFYTFNQKKTELQALLDKEYERLEKLNRAGEHISQLDNLDAADDIDTEIDAAIERASQDSGKTKDRQAAPAEIPVVTPAEDTVPPEIALKIVTPAAPAPVAPAAPASAPVAPAAPAPAAKEVPAVEYVGVVLAAAPAGIYISDSEGPETAVQNDSGNVKDSETAHKVAKKEVLPSKKEEEKAEGRKLTFGDVFNDDDDGYDESEGASKKGGCLKAIAIFLCIIVVIQLGLIGVQYFAPDSEPAKIINRGYSKVIEMISGTKDGQNPIDDTSDLDKIIESHASENKNIATVKEDASLAFENGKDYGFEDFEGTYKYENAPWYADENDNEITYMDGIVSTLIGYHSAWVDLMDGTDENVYDYVDSTSPAKKALDSIKADSDIVYSIESLSIGEIRFDGTGFYVLTKVAYVSSGDTDRAEEQQVVYLEPDNEKMKILSIVVL